MNHASAAHASQPPRALAIFAHPDDIEYFAGGTLLLLRQLGWETHYLNVSNGDKGSTVHGREALAPIRVEEARRAAAILGAVHHDSLATDMLIFYDEPLLRKVAAVVRRARPRIVLTHAPQDYMEDHMNVSRLAVTAAFTRGMPNFDTDPPAPGYEDDVVIYHAMPHGLRDQLRRPVEPDLFVDTSSGLETQRRALAAHASQQAWLDASQGAADFVDVLGTMSRAVGKMSGAFEHAEGWRRHLHLGYSAHDEDDPLSVALGERCRRNPRAQSIAKPVG
jgi:LmbE family N-acetylglucosaminyl deacetylase